MESLENKVKEIKIDENNFKPDSSLISSESHGVELEDSVEELESRDQQMPGQYQSAYFRNRSTVKDPSQVTERASESGFTQKKKAQDIEASHFKILADSKFDYNR